MATGILRTAKPTATESASPTHNVNCLSVVILLPRMSGWMWSCRANSEEIICLCNHRLAGCHSRSYGRTMSGFETQVSASGALTTYTAIFRSRFRKI